MYQKYNEPSNTTKELYKKGIKNTMDKMPQEAQELFYEENFFCGITHDLVVIPNEISELEEEVFVNFIHCVFSNGLYYFKFINWYEEFVIHLRDNFIDPCLIVYPPILWDMVLKTVEKNDTEIIWDFLNEYYRRDILGRKISVIKEYDTHFLSVGISGKYYFSAPHFLSIEDI